MKYAYCLQCEGDDESWWWLPAKLLHEVIDGNMGNAHGKMLLIIFLN